MGRLTKTQKAWRAQVAAAKKKRLAVVNATNWTRIVELDQTAPVERPTVGTMYKVFGYPLGDIFKLLACAQG